MYLERGDVRDRVLLLAYTDEPLGGRGAGQLLEQPRRFGNDHSGRVGASVRCLSLARFDPG